MLGIFDSHAHYDDARFDEDRDVLLCGMKDKGVSFIVNVSATKKGMADTLQLIEKYPFIYGSVGIHPEEVALLTDADLEYMKVAAKHDKIVAIGEIGLDYYYPEPPHDIQKEWFVKQLELACECEMPVIIHSRDAASDTLDILKQYTPSLPKGNPGVVHCYSYSAEIASVYVSMGYYIGIGGVLTFSNGKKLKQVAKEIPLERIVLETDCPYLAPVPHRGKRNDSGFLTHVADMLAEIKGITSKEVIDVTRNNALKMYGIEV